LRLQRFALKPLPLPDGEVRILDGQLGKRGRFSRGEGAVKSRKLAVENSHGPAVGRDVVHHQQQHVLFGVEPQQNGAQHQIFGQREPAVRFLFQPPVKFGRAVRARPVAQIDHREIDGTVGGDPLHGASVDGAERSAQRFVASDDLVQAAP
jgi:hypothetical protein